MCVGRGGGGGGGGPGEPGRIPREGGVLENAFLLTRGGEGLSHDVTGGEGAAALGDGAAGRDNGLTTGVRADAVAREGVGVCACRDGVVGVDALRRGG